MSIGTDKTNILKSALFKKHPRGELAANLYTGMKPRGGLIVGGVMAGVGVKHALSGGFGGNTINKNNPLTPMSTLDPGGVAMNRSQQAQAINPSILAGGRLPSTAPDLNATGDMVFGMHNGRHG